MADNLRRFASSASRLAGKADPFGFSIASPMLPGYATGFSKIAA
jgi:hypothetical protein